MCQVCKLLQNVVDILRIATTPTWKLHVKLTEQQNIHVWNCSSPIVRSPASEATYQWEGKAVIFTKWGILHFISSPQIQVSSTKILKNLQHYRLVVIHLQSPPPLSPASPPHPKSSNHTSRFHKSHASFALHNISFTLVPELMMIGSAMNLWTNETTQSELLLIWPSRFAAFHQDMFH